MIRLESFYQTISSAQIRAPRGRMAEGTSCLSNQLSGIPVNNLKGGYE
jgi:hypothetical protein